MDRKELYEYLKTLNPQDFKEVEVANPASFLRSIRDRLIKAKDVTKVIKRLIFQRWTQTEGTDRKAILVGIYDETLIGVYVKITYSYFAQEFEAEQVIIEQDTSIWQKIINTINNIIK